MRTYNRALDYTCLALNELKGGNATLAARLLAKAVEQNDITAAIATLEASNRHAFKLQQEIAAKAKAVKANDGFPSEIGEGGHIDAADEFGGDPLEEVSEPVPEPMEEVPAATMAKVLKTMVRKAGR